jgi:hypothetical protein
MSANIRTRAAAVIATCLLFASQLQAAFYEERLTTPQDSTESQIVAPMAGMEIAAEISKGRVFVEFRGEMVMINDTPFRRHVGGTILIFRNDIVIDRTQVAIATGPKRMILLPLHLPTYDTPGPGLHTYWVGWAAHEQGKTNFKVNHRVLRVITE